MSWEEWKARNASFTTPALLLALLILAIYRFYLLLCRLFGWRPRLP